MRSVRVAVLHGAGPNSGDHLIHTRAVALLARAFPAASLESMHRSKTGPDALQEYDAAVIAGGPLVTRWLHGQGRAVQDALERHAVPTVVLGVGIGGPHSTWGRRYFRKGAADLWNRLADLGPISVRDVATSRVLEAQGIPSVTTGCPALHGDPARLADNERPRTHSPPGTGPLLLSLPTATTRVAARRAARLIDWAARQTREVRLLFQHGASGPDAQNWHHAHDAGLSRIDAAGLPLQQIPEVMECTAHVGTRLHAGILTLGQRKPSFLLDVDNRTRAFLATYPAPGARFGARGLSQAEDWLDAGLPVDPAFEETVAAQRLRMRSFLEAAATHLAGS